MANLVRDLIDTYWGAAEARHSGLDGKDNALLNTGNSAVDAIWDSHVFEHAETFGGTEIGFARSLSAMILRRMLGVEHVALVSVVGHEIPSSGDDDLDEAFDSARREALDTFSGELLGPVSVAGRLVYAKPIQLDSAVPIGAAILASADRLTTAQQELLIGFLGHLDTRMNLAEKVLSLRRQTLDLQYEIGKLKGDFEAPPEPRRTRSISKPEDHAENMAALAAAVPSFELFGVALPSAHFESFCLNFDRLTDSYLTTLEQAEHLYLDVPSGIDAKDDGKLAAPYFRLLEIMGSIRRAARLLYQTRAEDLTPFVAGGQAPTFADLTRIAKDRTEDETTGVILDVMNDQGEDAEVDALTARKHPYEFRAANIGEVFALLALHQTLRDAVPEDFHALGRPIVQALPRYQAARAYLLAYDHFEDVPLKGADRTLSPDAEKLLLYREDAPSFGVLLAALTR